MAEMHPTNLHTASKTRAFLTTRGADNCKPELRTTRIVHRFKRCHIIILLLILIYISQAGLIRSRAWKNIYLGVTAALPTSTDSQPGVQKTRQFNQSAPSVRNIRGYYINLGTRPDRREAVEAQLGKLGIALERVEAVDVRNNLTVLSDCWKELTMNDTQLCAGKIGCKLSHIRAMDLAESSGDGIVAIFEDDFTWSPTVSASTIPDILLSFERYVPSWNVIGLSMNIMQQVDVDPTIRFLVGAGSNSTVVRVTNAQTTHGYVVRASYISTLRANFLTCPVHEGRNVAIDQCWKSLQKVDGWYGFSPQLGSQAPGYSDIENRDVRYEFT